MNLAETTLPGVWLIESDMHRDERGTFATHFSEAWFRERGLHHEFRCASTATNVHAGTLRGMHWQEAPHTEVKLVRCVRGAIYDVVLDLRPDSRTFGRWHAVELTPDDGRTLYVPAGCAHGYQTLADDSWVAYLISTSYHAGSARGVRWNDPAFAIAWPACAMRTMSARDASYGDYHE
jgi:dTDP-4-dehydrorhamnose 3,5-epimerase